MQITSWGCLNNLKENIVLVSLTVEQKYITAFQPTSVKHRTEPHLRNWWRSGYGMKSHPTDKSNIQIFDYLSYFIYIYIYIYIFLSLPTLSSWLSLNVLENEVNKTNKQTNNSRKSSTVIEMISMIKNFFEDMHNRKSNALMKMISTIHQKLKQYI